MRGRVAWAVAVAVVVGLACTPALALHVVQPQALAGRYINSPIYGKFFGPSTFPKTNLTAVLFEGDPCNPILTAGATTPLQGNYTGYLVVTRFTRTGACSLERRYLHLLASGAECAMEILDHPVPGMMYNAHDGDRGDRTKHKPMPWVDVAHNSFGDVMRVLESNLALSLDTNDPEYQAVVLEVSLPDKNRFKDMYQSAEFIAVVRGVVPAVLLATSLLAAQSTWSVWRGPSNAMKSTKLIVLVVEGFAMLVNGVFLALTGLFATDILPYPAVWFFGTGLYGWSMFTTVVVALFYRNLNTANRNFVDVRNTMAANRGKLVTVFVVFVGSELVIGALFASYAKADAMLVIGAGLYTVGNLATGLFFIVEKKRFHSTVKAEARKWEPGSRPQAIQDMCAHTGRWLVASSVFMFLTCIGTVLTGFSFAWSPTGLFVLTPALFLCRWGIGWTQIMALRWTPSSSKTASTKGEKASNLASNTVSQSKGQSKGQSQSQSQSQGNSQTQPAFELSVSHESHNNSQTKLLKD